jgi:hypothetical protein
MLDVMYSSLYANGFTWLHCKRHCSAFNTTHIPDLSPVCGQKGQEFKPQASPPHWEINASVILQFSKFVQLPSSSGVSVSGVERGSSARQ